MNCDFFKYLLKIERSVIAFDGKTQIYQNHDASLKDDFLKTPQSLSILILWLSNAVFNLLTWYFWTNLIYGLTHFDQPVWLQRGGAKNLLFWPPPVWKVSISEHISWSGKIFRRKVSILFAFPSLFFGGSLRRSTIIVIVPRLFNVYPFN